MLKRPLKSVVDRFLHTAAHSYSTTAAAIMSSSSSQPVLEGIFGSCPCIYLLIHVYNTNIIPAIHKPPSITSFDVIRSIQPTFRSSTLFGPLLSREKSRNLSEPRTKFRHKRDKRDLNLKIGHGGTLDPLATGVLIIGVGSGTKVLSRFLECTKSYECTVLFGCATDSYDAVGKVVGRAPYDHITKEMVEEALDKFRGDIMQKPPVFSALRVNGKRMHEYAREGGDIPEVKARPVTCTELELVEWLPGGSHEFEFPTEEASQEQRDMAEKIMGLNAGGWKRKNSISKAEESAGTASGPSVEVPPPEEGKALSPRISRSPTSQGSPPAAKLRMTVTSGFYVRSLCHDLGAAVGSLAIMSSLVRSRQGDYDITKDNVLPYEDLSAGENVWGPKVKVMLESWQESEGVTPESVEVKGSGDESDGGSKVETKKPKVHPRRERRRNSSSVER
jgi:tRNA pseudouridine55 synthase